VVFRDLLARENIAVPWREMLWAFRRMEARGTVAGGRFVHGFSGEQFAHPDAVGLLREIRKRARDGETVRLSAADPLNLVGILTPEARVPAIHSNRLLLEDGLPIAALEGGEVRRLVATKLGDEELRTLFARRTLRRALESHLRAPTAREAKALAGRVVH